MSFAILNVGVSGAGKTTENKRIIELTKKQPLVFATLMKDFPYPIIEDFYDFMLLASKRKDSILFIDEAQNAFPHIRPNPKNDHDARVLAMFANARKLNNLILINFHEFGDVPPWLVGKVAVIKRFKTQDDLTVQSRRFDRYPQLVECFQKYPEVKMHDHIELILRPIE